MWFWFSWRTNLSAIEQVIDAGKQAGSHSDSIPPWQPVEHALRKVDYLPGATEAGLMTGRRVDDLTAAAGRQACYMLRARATSLSLSVPAAPMLSEHGWPYSCFPSFHPRDTTGAGDAFNGALAARLACGASRPQPDSRQPVPPSVSKNRSASSLPEYTGGTGTASPIPPLIMKWHKPYCIKTLRG